jgi:heme-degrading monooxygenase HmoA
MPALPWTTVRTPDPTTTYVAFATRLPLSRHRYIPGFLRDTVRIRRQLRGAPGLLGYGLLAELGRATFWTVSVWEDEAALRAFAAAEPHRSVMRRVPARMGASAFRPFDVRGADVPIAWRDVKTRLA